MSSLDLKWLDDFISLKELGNFSAAAKVRHVTQSAFSRRIQALEIWVGTPLFDRTSYPVRLTVHGEKFVPYVERILLLIKETADDFAELSLQTDNSIRIVCLHSFALNLVPKLFQLIEGIYNQFNFHVIPSVQGIENHFNSLLDNSSDILLVYDMPDTQPDFLLKDKIEHMSVFATRIIPVIAPQLQSEFSRSAQTVPLPYLGYSRQTFLYSAVNAIVESHQLNFKTVFETTLSESLIKMAINGAGVAWAPVHAITEELEQGRLVRAFPENTELEIPLDVACYRSKESRRNAVNIFWNALQEAIGIGQE